MKATDSASAVVGGVFEKVSSVTSVVVDKTKETITDPVGTITTTASAGVDLGKSVASTGFNLARS